MSEDNNDLKIIKDKPRCKKLNPRIDMTAMVSVSFLLIIFFMVTKELARPQAMSLGLPERCGECGEGGCYYGGDGRRITLLLDDHDKIISYSGFSSSSNSSIKEFNYGKGGIRKLLTEMNARIIKETGDNGRGAIVLIKPSKKSNYGNLVDILDEMAIAKIPTYAIINDFTPEEVKLLASK